MSTQYRELLQIVLTVLERPGAASELKVNMSGTSRKIAQSVTELVAAAEMLKGKKSTFCTILCPYQQNKISNKKYCVSGADMEDPDDPTVIAENELLGAAASIDAAAKKLASLRPRRSVQVSRLTCMCVSGCWCWVFLVLSSRAFALFGECVSLWRLLPYIYFSQPSPVRYV